VYSQWRTAATAAIARSLSGVESTASWRTCPSVPMVTLRRTSPCIRSRGRLRIHWRELMNLGSRDHSARDFLYGTTCFYSGSGEVHRIHRHGSKRGHLGLGGFDASLHHFEGDCDGLALEASEDITHHGFCHVPGYIPKPIGAGVETGRRVQTRGCMCGLH